MAEVDTILHFLVEKEQNSRVAKGPILKSLLTWLLLCIALKIYSVNNISCIYERKFIVICTQFLKANY